MKTDKNEKNEDRCWNNNKSNRLLLLLEAQPTKATTKKPKTTTANKQTNKQTRSKNLQFSQEEEGSKDKFRASLLF
jgi:hypothetical protein